MTVYVISDLHMDEHGQARLFDDERQGRLLAELCGRVEGDEGSELVLLGDCFDFTAMQPPPKGLDRFSRRRDAPGEVPPRRTLPQLLEAVRGSNPVAFEALAQLAKKTRVTVVPGNHDHHLGAPSAAQQLASAGIAARLEPWLVREL